MIFYRLEKLWHEWGFNILLILSLTFLFVAWIFSKKGSGTYSVKPVMDLSAPKQAYSPPSRSTNYRMDSPAASFSDFSNGKESALEKACRRALQDIFGRPFNKARPDFLRNPVTKDFNLELDCFEPDLKLAVEAQGVQHYKYVPFFHKSKEAYQNQQYRDELKRRMCRDNGINLVEVPYTVKPEDVKGYILERLRVLKYRV